MRMIRTFRSLLLVALFSAILVVSPPALAASDDVGPTQGPTVTQGSSDDGGVVLFFTKLRDRLIGLLGPFAPVEPPVETKPQHRGQGQGDDGGEVVRGAGLDPNGATQQPR